MNSGGGYAAAKLAAAGFDVTVIEREERLLPGVARNIGIRATTAEHVAFLASDCRAAPGWAANRLAKHRKGSAAVASALLPLPADSPIAWASHLSLFARRLPLNSRLTALPYGGSFHRSLFESYGLFSEELRIGEDTEFALRLPLKVRPVWAPDVVTLHETSDGSAHHAVGSIPPRPSRFFSLATVVAEPNRFFPWVPMAAHSGSDQAVTAIGLSESESDPPSLAAHSDLRGRLLAGCRLAAQSWIGSVGFVLRVP